MGLAISDGATAANYFIFLLLLFSVSLTTGLFYSIFSASVRVVTIAQAAMAVVSVVLVVFCGFTVQPDVIPPYYIWIYWGNYFAWALRALCVNEFQSGQYDNIMEGSGGLTQGEQILIQFGITDGNGDPYTSEWVWWGFLFTLGWGIFSMTMSIICLKRIRFTTGASLVTDSGSDEEETFDESQEVTIPFTRVNLTFKNIHYRVMSSIT